MDFFDTVLWPLKVAVAWIMVRAHDVLTFIGMDPAGGWTWVLSIVALVIVIRVLLIPLFVRQIKASRGMQLVQPEIQKLQKKYKGKTDPASRQAMQQEMMAIYREAGTSPFASCLPILAQMPIFFALFRVLASLSAVAAGDYPRASIGPLTQELAAQAEASSIFGASLSSTFMGEGATIEARVVTAVLILLMSATTLFTQRQLTMKNMPASALDNPMARQQKMLMYIFPLIFMFTGVHFPIGVLIYWTTSNVWTMGQQFFVIRNSPAPGSEAEKKYLERKARKKKRRSGTASLEDADHEVPQLEDAQESGSEPSSGQRAQPKKAPRSKRRPAGGAADQGSGPKDEK
ncbi:membrane protein insertase YidC [Ruania halotolerans]|uniref:membrane protein insertase YidC n=1 Tax=Ruania halotolerans TaxID=2897773 RepID=UPI001E4B12E8|nr:membrane protein insertase YidC [Ruania halotolerans]UFU06533.1 membrane protein insertase YidC [Ruania halotolerans]